MNKKILQNPIHWIKLFFYFIPAIPNKKLIYMQEYENPCGPLVKILVKSIPTKRRIILLSQLTT